jgi:site-specific DNA recombinase
MSIDLSINLKPRNGRQLRVLIICRVSSPGPGKQDIRSLEDQKKLAEDWLKNHTSVPYEIQVVAGSGSGERLDREESKQARDLVESGAFDLVLTEDLGRIFRRMESYLFCELAVDYNTRLIALNDGVDTAQENWHINAVFSSLKHESSNSDTSKRIRRTLRSRFSQGGIVQTTIYGYVKPHPKATDAELRKDPDAEPIYEVWFTLLENGASFAEVADWLNESKVPLGHGCQVSRWTGPMVGQITRNPLLKGVRVRNAKMSKRINSTGRRRSVKAPPEERLERQCPHLAFIDEERYDRVIRMLERRNAGYRRRFINGVDPRANVPKKRSKWPGQHLTCGVCGRLYVWGGHGLKDYLMCRGAKNYQCWNAISVHGPRECQKIVEAVFGEIQNFSGFDEMLIAKVDSELQKLHDQSGADRKRVEGQIQSCSRELGNLIDFIKEGNASRIVSEELSRLEGQLDELNRERDQILQRPDSLVALPTVDEVKDLARVALRDQFDSPWKFARLMQSLIPKIELFPVRLIDGGRIELRARFQLSLARFLPSVKSLPGFENLQGKEFTSNLFEPPQREAFRMKVVKLRASGMTEKKAVQQLGINATVAQRAAALQRLMDARGISDPYIEVTAPPDDYTKLCRHKHRRYRFQRSN